MKFARSMQNGETICTVAMVALAVAGAHAASEHPIAMGAAIVGSHLIGIVSGMLHCYRRNAEKAGT